VPYQKEFEYKGVRISIHPSKSECGKAAAKQAIQILKSALQGTDVVRIIVGTGNSQEEVIETLVHEDSLEWHRIEVFHMDEYVGLSAEHPASFRRWLRDHLVDRAKPGCVHFLAGDASDLDAECIRYAGFISRENVDLCFLGFGENGHIAFNDPHEADFNDPKVVKRVWMDERCRLQQVGEGHFHSLDSVPREALTLTCPVLLSAKNLICTVPEKRKAEAVRNAIEGPLTTECPASSIFKHENAWLFLDADSASLLQL
jgi:glucosamine-6-phosphate deaminase